jgi:SAM-dependent methyltransferase
MIEVTAVDHRQLRLPWSALVANKAHEFWIKGTGRRIKGQGMIGADASSVEQGFSSLHDQDFDNYNLPQAWVERRQIPRAIRGRIPQSHAVVVDLGCGPGTSTAVLCHFASLDWTLIGFDFMPHLIAAARARAQRGEFRNRSGQAMSPHFEQQDIAQPLLVKGQPIESSTVDFAISGGVVGLYLDLPRAERLAGELARIIKPTGYAAIDCGPAVPAEILERSMVASGFRLVETVRSFIIDPRPKLVFARS